MFNQNLHQFLGRKEISLMFDRKVKGYRIAEMISRQKISAKEKRQQLLLFISLQN